MAYQKVLTKFRFFFSKTFCLCQFSVNGWLETVSETKANARITERTVCSDDYWPYCNARKIPYMKTLIWNNRNVAVLVMCLGLLLRQLFLPHIQVRYVCHIQTSVLNLRSSFRVRHVFANYLKESCNRVLRSISPSNIFWRTDFVRKISPK